MPFVEFVGQPRAKVWHPELFEEPLVIDSIADHPERIRDQPYGTGCIGGPSDQYGLFDEDILYEDLCLAAAVNAHVARLAVIPECCLSVEDLWPRPCSVDHKPTR